VRRFPTNTASPASKLSPSFLALSREAAVTCQRMLACKTLLIMEALAPFFVLLSARILSSLLEIGPPH
jgi:hypothetical protein